MAHVEPMDLDCIDSDFDNKENTYQHNNALPRGVSSEKGYEDLDVSDLNMKLRYSVTPAASPMSKSFTANCTEDKIYSTVEDALNGNRANLTRSFNSTFTNSDSILKSPKSLPLQSLSSDNFTDLNRNSSIRRSLDAPKNNVTVTITPLHDIDDNLSVPSTSSSLTHTPEATTPTKEIPKQDGSPIMRGLKSVLSMFRTSQSPIPPAEEPNAEKKDLSVTQPEIQDTNKQTVLASTPIRNKKCPSKAGSPLKESVVFIDDLERELQWKEDSTIIFKEEKIPIHKLFLPSLPVEVKSTNNLTTEIMNNTVEYMDISLHESALNEQVKNSKVMNPETICAESDSEFQDCETTFTKTEHDDGQNKTDGIIGPGTEISQENINMSIVENEYHESVSLPTSVCVVNASPVIQPSNDIPQEGQGVQKENEIINVQETESNEENVSEPTLPDVVEITLKKNIGESDSKAEVLTLESLNTTFEPEYLKDDEKDQTHELIKNETMPISIDNKEHEVNNDLNKMNEEKPVEIHQNNTNDNTKNTIEEEEPHNEETEENSSQLEKIDEQKVEVVVHELLSDQAILEPENINDISIVKDIMDVLKSNVVDADLCDQNVIENTPIQADYLEESNIKLVYDDLNETTVMSTAIINNMTNSEDNQNNSININNIQTETDIDTSNMTGSDNVTTQNNENNITININDNMNDVLDRQDKETEAKVISPEPLPPAPLSDIVNSDDIDNIESQIHTSVPPFDIPLPSEGEDDKANDCNEDNAPEENIPESFLLRTYNIKADEDKSLLNVEAPNTFAPLNSEIIESQKLFLGEDPKKHATFTEDLSNATHANEVTRNQHDNITINEINVTEVKDSNDINLNYFENKNNFENTLNINTYGMIEERQCDMEVENALLSNIEEPTEPKKLDDKIDDKMEEKLNIKNMNSTSNDITVNTDETVAENNINLDAEVEAMDIDCTKVNNDIDIKPFDTKCKILSTPPSSPKIVSKSYNFNFDEIDDPFATKTKIRESPPPFSPPNNTFQPINNQGKRKPVITNRKPIQNRRKSQPVPKVEPSTKKGMNTTFDGSTFSNKSLDDLKTEESKFEKSTSANESNKNEINVPHERNIDIGPNEDKIQLEIETNQNNIVEDNKFVADPTLTVADTSVEIIRKNVFNIPEIDDRNFNPFASRSKVCVSPLLQNKNSTIEDEPNNASVCDITVNINNIEGENNLGNNIEKESPSDLSNITFSSKQTDERNETVKEINTEDEDTIEGPFLEPGEFVDFDKDTDILPTLEKDDMIGFDDFPMQSNNEENGDNAEIFIDAEAFEFLLNQNKSNVVADSGKESLFLKFDPLFAKRVSSDGILAALNKPTKRVSTPKKSQFTKPDLQSDHFTAGPSSSKPVASNNNEDVNITKPTMIVNPAVNSVPSPRKASTPPKINRQSLTFTSPAMAVIDRLLSLSGNSSFLNHDTTVPQVTAEQHQTDVALTQLREMLAEKEIHVQSLRSEREELKDRLAAMETQVKSLESESEDRLKKLTELNLKLTEKTKENKTMAVVVEEYERTIASLVAELEQDKRRNAEERMKLIRDRDEQTAHLASMEVSFSDLHSKYEKSKQIIFSLKANEDTYKKSVKEFEENLIKMQNNYELLKQHATTKLNHANSELEKMNKAHEAEVLKLNAMIKRKDLHITSLEETLAQKTKANEELTAICDELINKVG